MVWVDGSGGEFELTQDLVFRDWAGHEWTTKKGSRSDLSSVPWWARWRVPKSRFGKAPFLHDENYRHNPHALTRKQCDLLYYQGIIDEEIERFGCDSFDEAVEKGMEPWKLKVLYMGLGLGGWWSWRKYRKLEEELREELEK